MMAGDKRPIAGVPVDVLLHIFEILVATSPSTLLPCIRCCRSWQPVASSVLYRDIVLHNVNLDKFLDKRDRHDTICTRSLSVRLGVTDLTQTELQELLEAQRQDYGAQIKAEGVLRGTGSKLTRAIWQQLILLTTRIRDNFRQLQSFSLVVPPWEINHYGDFAFWLPRSLLGEVLQSLPRTCSNLELDTYGIDADFAESDDNHVCVHVRKLLPQLSHLRLRLTAICPAVFADDFDFSRAFTSESALRRPHMLHASAALESCMINVITPMMRDGSPESTCCSGNDYKHSDSDAAENLQAQYYLSRTIGSHRVALNSVYPRLKCLQVIGKKAPPLLPPRQLSFFTRRDYISKQTWIIPIDESVMQLLMLPPRPPTTLIRLPGIDEDLLTNSPQTVEALVEDLNLEQPVKDARVLSAKIPGRLLRNLDPGQVQSRSEYESSPGATIGFWHNEDKCGQRTFWPYVKEGIEHGETEFYQRRFPEGWVWDHRRDELERA